MPNSKTIRGPLILKRIEIGENFADIVGNASPQVRFQSYNGLLMLKCNEICMGSAIDLLALLGKCGFQSRKNGLYRTRNTYFIFHFFIFLVNK